MKDRVTARTVASVVGVSVGTVDRALNNRGRINEKTKKEILEASELLHYKPNKIASALGRQKTVRIAAIFPREPVYFFDKMLEGFGDAQRELSDYGVAVDFIFTESLNPAAEEVVLRELNPSLYDGILLNAGGSALNKYIDAYADAGKPVVTFNSDVDSSKRLFHVGHDDSRSGAMAAGLLGEFLQGQGDVVILTGFNTVRAHSLRVHAFERTMRTDYPLIRIVERFEYEDREEKAFAMTKETLRRLGGIAGIFASSAPGSVGAGRAIAETNPDGIPRVVGYDVNEHVQDLMKRGFCTAVIYQDPYGQSHSALKLIAQHLLEGWIPKRKHLYIRPKIVIRQNVDEYVRKQMRASEILDDLFV